MLRTRPLARRRPRWGEGLARRLETPGLRPLPGPSAPGLAAPGLAAPGYAAPGLAGPGRPWAPAAFLWLSRTDRTSPTAPTIINRTAPGQRTAWSISVANRWPISSPTTGIPASKTPNTRPTSSRTRAFTPVTPMPMAAARFDSPTATAASNRAITATQYPGKPRGLTAAGYPG